MAISAARGQVLLQVNDADPSAVTFTATDAPSAADYGNSVTFGINLATFFTATPDGSLPNSSFSNLTSYITPPGGEVFNGSAANNFNGSQADLNLFNTGNLADPETFHQGTQALTGSAVVDLSGVASLLPAPGVTGDIYSVFFLTGDSALIGSYEVVPEPPGWAAVCAGAAALAMATRRKRQAFAAEATAACE